MIPWLFSVLDYESTPETYSRYDDMSAKDMFKMYGVSKAMYEGFIKPTLLVALFAPPEVCISAFQALLVKFQHGMSMHEMVACFYKQTIALVGNVADDCCSPCRRPQGCVPLLLLCSVCVSAVAPNRLQRRTVCDAGAICWGYHGLPLLLWCGLHWSACVQSEGLSPRSAICCVSLGLCLFACTINQASLFGT